MSKVYEGLDVTDEVWQLMMSAAPPREMSALAASQGMRSMGTEAMALVTNDVTTIDEVIRNVYISEPTQVLTPPGCMPPA